VLLTGRRRWLSIFGLSIDQLVAWGVLYYAYAVLSKPIARDLDVHPLVVAGAFSACLIAAGLTGRRVGALLDQRGTRGVLRLGAMLAPPTFAALAVARDIPSLIGVFLLLGVAQAMALYEPAFRAIVDWCPDERSRSRAMLALTSVAGFASTAFLPLTGWLVEREGWRATVAILAAILAVVIVPARLLLPLSTRSALCGTIAQPAERPRSFRYLAGGLSLYSLASTGVFVYLIWQLVERGESAGAAAAIAGIAGAAQVPGRVLAAPLRRAAGAASFLAILLALQAMALAGIVAGGGVVATGCVFIFGAANGMMTLERATVLVEWYGRSRFGTSQGELSAMTNTARAVAPFAVEVGHTFASYGTVFGVLAVVLAAGAMMCRVAARVQATDATHRPDVNIEKVASCRRAI
jgi:MFS family permease